MPEEVEFRKFRFADYHRAIGMWKETPGIGISAADGPGPMKAFLRRNRGLSFVALQGGMMIGTVLAGHDGRRAGSTTWQKRDDILVFSASLLPGSPGAGTRSTGQC